MLLFFSVVIEDLNHISLLFRYPKNSTYVCDIFIFYLGFFLPLRA